MLETSESMRTNHIKLVLDEESFTIPEVILCVIKTYSKSEVMVFISNNDGLDNYCWQLTDFENDIKNINNGDLIHIIQAYDTFVDHIYGKKINGMYYFARHCVDSREIPRMNWAEYFKDVPAEFQIRSLV